MQLGRGSHCRSDGKGRRVQVEGWLSIQCLTGDEKAVENEVDGPEVVHKQFVEGKGSSKDPEHPQTPQRLMNASLVLFPQDSSRKVPSCRSKQVKRTYLSIWLLSKGQLAEQKSDGETMQVSTIMARQRQQLSKDSLLLMRQLAGGTRQASSRLLRAVEGSGSRHLRMPLRGTWGRQQMGSMGEREWQRTSRATKPQQQGMRKRKNYISRNSVVSYSVGTSLVSYAI